MRGLAVRVRDRARGRIVLRLGLVPDDRDLAGVARRDPRPEDPRARMGDRDRMRPRPAEIAGRDHHDRVRSGSRQGRPGHTERARAAATRTRLAVVGIPDDVDRPAGVDRDRGPVAVHRRAAVTLVRPERRHARVRDADPDAEGAVPVAEDRGLDDAAGVLVVDQLSECGP